MIEGGSKVEISEMCGLIDLVDFSAAPRMLSKPADLRHRSMLWRSARPWRSVELVAKDCAHYHSVEHVPRRPYSRPCTGRGIYPSRLRKMS